MQTYFPENTEEAIDCYEKLLEFDIDTAQIYYELGHLYMSKDDKLNSVSAFKLAVDREPENPFSIILLDMLTQKLNFTMMQSNIIKKLFQ